MTTVRYSLHFEFRRKIYLVIVSIVVNVPPTATFSDQWAIQHDTSTVIRAIVSVIECVKLFCAEQMLALYNVLKLFSFEVSRANGGRTDQ